MKRKFLTIVVSDTEKILQGKTFGAPEKPILMAAEEFEISDKNDNLYKRTLESIFEWAEYQIKKL